MPQYTLTFVCLEFSFLVQNIFLLCFNLDVALLLICILGMQGPPSNAPISAQIEWQKLHDQFYGRSGPPIPRGMPGTGPRLQGPPPPYHQTPRSASVPIALQSPSPASPNNPTSNLSLPSPRASSALNSPADPNRPFGLSRHMSTGQSPTSQDSPTAQRLNHSNPGTPVSSHLSPSVTTSSTEPSSTHQSTGNILFFLIYLFIDTYKMVIISKRRNYN